MFFFNYDLLKSIYIYLYFEYWTYYNLNREELYHKRKIILIKCNSKIQNVTYDVMLAIILLLCKTL